MKSKTSFIRNPFWAGLIRLTGTERRIHFDDEYRHFERASNGTILLRTNGEMISML